MERLGSSFRDPSGFVFTRSGVTYRQVNLSYAEDYNHLITSGLFAELVESGLLIGHVEVDEPPSQARDAFKVLRPEEVPFISYPYEWCIGQLLDAALLTLEIQERAIRKGMTLKDASAFNVQYLRGKPIFIDTLSFERISEASPAWIAYRQFCEHFIAPISLMFFRDEQCGRLFTSFIDGIPLDFACKLLPRSAFLNFHRTLHLLVHAWANRRFKKTRSVKVHVSERRRLALVDSLKSSIKGLRRKSPKSYWSTYYPVSASYYPETKGHKEEVVRKMLATIKPVSVWDLGCNTGAFSMMAVAAGARTVVAADSDGSCIEALYCALRANGNFGILPLTINLTNPTPAIGWHNSERMSLIERGPADLALALAITHHLVISYNISVGQVAEFLCRCAHQLIVEYVDIDDPMSKSLLERRSAPIHLYTKDDFEGAFSIYFDVLERVALTNSQRIIYRMIRKEKNWAAQIN